MNNPNEQWHYIGDGVYMKYDGFGVMLHANDHANPTDKVYLEPDVIGNLVKIFELEAKKAQFHKGMKVTYIAAHAKKEHGRIKSFAPDGAPFVVYNCGGNWDKYEDYTAARTNFNDLTPGWI